LVQVSNSSRGIINRLVRPNKEVQPIRGLKWLTTIAGAALRWFRPTDVSLWQREAK
jgi:hypothetical protein